MTKQVFDAEPIINKPVAIVDEVAPPEEGDFDSDEEENSLDENDGDFSSDESDLGNFVVSILR